MKKITIRVEDKDYRKIRYIGLKIWTEVTLEEKEDYLKLLEKMGTLVCRYAQEYPE